MNTRTATGHVGEFHCAVNCPECGRLLRLANNAANVFPCPGCGAGLHFSDPVVTVTYESYVLDHEWLIALCDDLNTGRRITNGEIVKLRAIASRIKSAL